nr:tetratricopeptide repeat protein [Roseospira goensis]
MAAHAAGDLPAATDGYRAALAADPAEADALNLLGLAHYQRGEVDAALALLDRACRVAPDAVPARINLGTLHQDLGDLERAETHYRHALARAPDEVAALNNLGNTLTDLDQATAALALFDRALDHATGRARAEVLYNQHALLLDRVGPAVAERAVTEAVTLAPDHALAWIALAMLRAARGATDAADAALAVVAELGASAAALLDSAQTMRPWLVEDGARLLGSTIGGLAFALEHAHEPGLVLEFGVRFGHSLRAIAARAGQHVHGFDTFTGLPRAWYGHAPGLYSTGGVLPAMPPDVTLHAGLFADTLPGVLAAHPGAAVRFANIDCDLYESTRDVLTLLAPRLRPGSVLAFDEYLMNPDWRADEYRAFQKAVAHHGWRPEILGVSPFSKQAVIRLA